MEYIIIGILVVILVLVIVFRNKIIALFKNMKKKDGATNEK